MNAYFVFLILLILSSILSYAIMGQLAHLSRAYWFYRIILFPGIVIHEMSHVLACIITGTQVEKISLWTETGGQMIHQKPKMPWLTQPIISFAPLAVGIVAISFLGHWVLTAPWLWKIPAGVLMISVAATLSPSKVDILHSIEGLIFIAGVVIGVSLFAANFFGNFADSVGNLNQILITVDGFLAAILILILLSQLGLKKTHIP